MDTETNSSEAVLYPSVAKWLTFLALGIIWILYGVYLMPKNSLAGTKQIIFGSLMVIVCLPHSIPGASYLKLNAEGFTFCSFFRRRTVQWEDVAEFRVVGMRRFGVRRKQTVGWIHISNCPENRMVRSMNASFMDCDGFLPDTYMMSADKLCAFLQNCRAQVVANAQENTAARMAAA